MNNAGFRHIVKKDVLIMVAVSSMYLQCIYDELLTLRTFLNHTGWRKH